LVAGGAFRRLPEPEGPVTVMTSVRHLLAGRSSAVDAALLLLRVFAGVAFVLHGWGKVINVSGFAAEQGVPVVLGAAAAYVQFIGRLLLVVGLLTPLAAFGIGVTMVVAVVMLVRSGESFINPGGHSWESAALYAVVMLCLMMLGAGRYALDAMLFTRDSVADRAASSIARGGGAP
jgi:putative oxidoreductase